jgi:outer membrane murein-binding lipoprotein Lpp
MRALTGEKTILQLDGKTLILESDTEKTYNRDVLINGLYVNVITLKTQAAELVAAKVTFTRQDLKFARIIEAQIDQLTNRVSDAEAKVSQIESQSQRLSGQLEELAAVSNAARGGSKAAQETADTAIATINAIVTQLGLDVAKFPWPPPRASATTAIPQRFVLQQEGATILSHVSERLQTALNEAGYSELSWYAVPGGFALTTRIEQFKPDGRPASGQARWSVSDVPAMQGLSDYMRALFTANPGHYRVIVFIVSDRPLSQSDARVSEADATAWLHRGMTALPKQIGDGPFSAAHNCTALIYHFKRIINQPPTYVDSSPLLGRQHLQQSGVWRELTR